MGRWDILGLVQNARQLGRHCDATTKSFTPALFGIAISCLRWSVLFSLGTVFGIATSCLRWRTVYSLGTSQQVCDTLHAHRRRCTERPVSLGQVWSIQYKHARENCLRSFKYITVFVSTRGVSGMYPEGHPTHGFILMMA